MAAEDYLGSWEDYDPYDDEFTLVWCKACGAYNLDFAKDRSGRFILVDMQGRRHCCRASAAADEFPKLA